MESHLRLERTNSKSAFQRSTFPDALRDRRRRNASHRGVRAVTARGEAPALLSGETHSTSMTRNFVFDWSSRGARRARWPSGVMLYDETLRDGLQSPSVIDPPIETKLEILHLLLRAK